MSISFNPFTGNFDISSQPEPPEVESVNGQIGHVILTAADIGAATDEQGIKADTAVQPADLDLALQAKADLVGGVVPSSQLPSIAISDFLGAVSSEAEMLGLSGGRGDWTIRTDTSTTWILANDDPGIIGSWVELPTPADAVISVNGMAGVVVLGHEDVGAANAAQGLKAETAVQPETLSQVAFSGLYNDLSGRPTIGDAASRDIGTTAGTVCAGDDDRLTNSRSPISHTHPSTQISDSTPAGRTLLTAQDNAAQRNALGLGTAAVTDSGIYATASQGIKADTAVQPSELTSSLAVKADLINGVIPSSQIPAIAISEFLGSVSSEAAMLALVGQRGDWAIRTDLSKAWVLAADDSSLIGSWVELPAPASPIASINGKTGVVVLSASDVGAATSAQGAKADSAVQPSELTAYVQTSDSRLTDAREWSASTVTQAVAEAGTATTRVAWTVERVWQAIAAWWAQSNAATKLATIESGAQVNVGTNLSYTASTRLLQSSTGSGANLPLVTSTNAGLAPASGGGTSTFLRSDGTWQSTKQMIFGFTANIKRGNATYFSVIGGNANATESLVTVPMPIGGTLKSLRIKLSVNASPTINVGYTFTVRVNGVNSPLSVNILGALNTGSNLVASASFNAGDELSIVATPTATQPTDNIDVIWTAEYLLS